MIRATAMGGFWAVLAVMTFAQDRTFTATVDPQKVPAGQQFTLVFTLNDSHEENFTPPDLRQFVVMGDHMRLQTDEMRNGRFSSSVTYTYSLYANQPGKYTIGSATIQNRGKILKSNPVQVEVIAAGKGSRQTSQATQQNQGATQDIGDNLLIRAIPNKSRVRQGEQFIVTYKLYTRINISDYGIAKVPTYEGFWAEDFEQPKSPEVTTETLNGKQYRVVTLRSTALFATQAGSLKISPLEVRCAVQVRRRNNDPFDIFNDPFFSRFETAQYEFKSNALTITVDPLPRAPEGFLGAVGTYTFNATVDKREVKTGDPITLKLTVSGTGNIRLVSIPEPSFPADLETYEPKVAEEISRDRQLIRGKKVAEYLLIPRNAGTRVIEPVSFTFYDLPQGAYVTLRSPRFDLTIAPGREASPATAGLASKEEIRLLGEDIRFLKLTAGDLRPEDASPVESSWFLVGVIVPPLLFLSVFAFRRREERLRGNLWLVRSQKAGREAAKRLKAAKRVLAQGNTESYHAEISKALIGYLSDKLRIPMASLTIESTIERLTQRGVSRDLIQQVAFCMERAEFARFAPAADTQQSRQDLLEAARKAIEDIEKSLNGRS